MTPAISTIFLPGRVRVDPEGKPLRDAAGRLLREPAEPAPPLLTEEEAVRLLRLDGDTGPDDPYRTLYRYREMGNLHATRMGKCVCYRLEELLRLMREQTEGSSARRR